MWDPIAAAPEASNPELILEGTPHGDDPNMPPVPAPVLPDVSAVLPPGNPPPVVYLPEGATVDPIIEPPPVWQPSPTPSVQPAVGPALAPDAPLQPAPVMPGVVEVLPPGGPPPVVQLPENAYVVPTIPNPPVFNPNEPFVAPSNPATVTPPVQQPQILPPDVDESQIPLLPLPEPPPPAAVPDYLPEPPMITYDPEDHITLMPKPSSQPAYEQPSSTYAVPGTTYVPDYTYDAPDSTYDSESSYGGSGSSYGDSGFTYGDSGSSYDDSGSTYDDSGSTYGDTDSSYGGTVCDEDGYCS